jgi:hypothetical protein
LLSTNLRPARIHLLEQTEGVFLPRPGFERQVEAFARVSNFRFRDRGEV